MIPSLPCVSGRKGSLCHTKVIGSLPGFDVSLFNTYTWFVVFKCVLASSHAKVAVVSCSVLMVLIVLYCFGGYMAARQLLLSSATTVLNDLENDPLCHSPYLQEWVGMIWFVWEKLKLYKLTHFPSHLFPKKHVIQFTNTCNSHGSYVINVLHLFSQTFCCHQNFLKRHCSRFIEYPGNWWRKYFIKIYILKPKCTILTHHVLKQTEKTLM